MIQWAPAISQVTQVYSRPRTCALCKRVTAWQWWGMRYYPPAKDPSEGIMGLSAYAEVAHFYCTACGWREMDL